MGLAGLMTQREIHEYGTWRIYGPRDIQRRCHAQRRDSRRFNHSCDQSNGLMAYGSRRYQVKGLDVRPFQFIRDSRREFIAYLARRVDPAHKAVSGIG